jgi:hypothetical protein
MKICIRVGDGGELEIFNDLAEALEYLNECEVGQVTRWRSWAPFFVFDTENFHGEDCVHCYWGDRNGNPLAILSLDQRAFIERRLIACYL